MEWALLWGVCPVWTQIPMTLLRKITTGPAHARPWAPPSGEGRRKEPIRPIRPIRSLFYLGFLGSRGHTVSPYGPYALELELNRPKPSGAVAKKVFALGDGDRRGLEFCYTTTLS